MHNPGNVKSVGTPLDQAKKVMVMIHGRGSSAQSILTLSQYFNAEEMAFVAPWATGNSWYPNSFLAPMDQNEPGLSSALSVIHEVITGLHTDQGFAFHDIFLLGFSQGACLALEYSVRNPLRYGGILGLSGGLIGPEGTPRNYPGSLDNTPVFLGCSDIDQHIPKKRVEESNEVFKRMGANVQMKLYENFGHSINDDEIDIVNQVITNGSW